MKKLLFATILCMAILTGCGQAEHAQSTAEQSVTTLAETAMAESAATTVNTTTTMESKTTETAEPEYTDNDVDAAQNWQTGIWNYCVDISAYVKSGTDCTGKDIDMVFYIEGAKIDYAKKEQYDAVIHALDDSVPEQKMLIMAWDKSLEQADTLMNKAFAETPQPNDENYEFDLDLFQQYSKQFRDLLNEVKYGDSNAVVVSSSDNEPKFVFVQSD